MTLSELFLFTFMGLFTFFGACALREYILRRVAQNCDCTVPDGETCKAKGYPRGCYWGGTINWIHPGDPGYPDTPPGPSETLKWHS